MSSSSSHTPSSSSTRSSLHEDLCALHTPSSSHRSSSSSHMSSSSSPTSSLAQDLRALHTPSIHKSSSSSHRSSLAEDLHVLHTPSSHISSSSSSPPPLPQSPPPSPYYTDNPIDFDTFKKHLYSNDSDNIVANFKQRRQAQEKINKSRYSPEYTHVINNVIEYADVSSDPDEDTDADVIASKKALLASSQHVITQYCQSQRRRPEAG
jgi:hypothetical protein